MSLGPLMIDVAGTALDAAERERLAHPLVGGVILFARNYASPEQLAELVAEIHALRRTHLLVAVDHEGGRVQRFREGFTRLPPAACLGECYGRDRARALHLAEEAGWLMASELRALGVDFSFAPVLDLRRHAGGVIGDRAFGRSPDAVADMGLAYMRGMQEAGMAAVAKHFPGHGGVGEDSHLTLPEDGRDYADIAASDLVPFERLVANGVPGIMSAHILYSRVAPLPATYSTFWLREVLRKRLGFQGVVFSDDLSMAGAGDIGGYGERARHALEAGCDMLLVCNAPEAVGEVLAALEGHADPVAQLRRVRLHGKHPVDPARLRRTTRWRDAVRLLGELEREPLLDIDL
ncbi:MAG: beta-N-acetylhexosaminidase [Gammaproteobacteria bacterium]|nr:beta-N-acetylhexosaminidase [Gammaproteobacteria bacterium]